MQKLFFKIKMSKKSKGLSLLEIVLAVAIFAIFAVGVAGLIIQGLEQNRLAGDQTVATQYASEGLEAVQSIRNQSFATLAANAGTGVAPVSGLWAFNGANNTYDSGRYTRVIKVEAVQRDVGGNIVASGGTTDTNTFKITSTVTWNFTAVRQNSVVLSTYLTGYGVPVTPNKKNGMLVYGDGQTITDSIQYRVFDANAGNWDTAQSLADIDGSTNRAARVVKIYASSTRNEKIVLSRHSDGTSQYIYGQVWNGTTWGNVQLMSSWANNTFLDVQNFDGTYLNNGDFMVVYKDTTTTPKSRVWNGSSWGNQVSTQNVGGIANYIVVKQRPATNEVMVVTMDEQNDTNSEYFNGGTYITANWTLHSQHSTQAPVNTKRMIDFTWNTTDPLKGMLVFSNNQNDRNIRYKMFTANGIGGGSWSNTTNGANQGTNPTRIGVLGALSRPNATEFLACSQNTVPQIICYRSDTALTITNPINQIIAAATESGIQKTFDMAYELKNYNYAVFVYSDNSVTPKIKKYDPLTNTFDQNPISMTNLGGVMKAARLIPQNDNDDIMILVSDADKKFYSQVWDGTSHQLYSSADAWNFTTQGTNGSDPADYFYDFAWDN